MQQKHFKSSFRPEELERHGAHFELISEPTWLTEDIVVSGEEPMTTSFESVANCFFLKNDNGYVPDPCVDNQSVYIRTELGLIIVLGCAHRGMINIIRHAQQLMNTDKVYMVLGGTHLGPASEEQVVNYQGSKGYRFAVAWRISLYWSKCGGKTETDIRKQVFFNNTGTIITFPAKQ